MQNIEQEKETRSSDWPVLLKSIVTVVVPGKRHENKVLALCTAHERQVRAKSGLSQHVDHITSPYDTLRWTLTMCGAMKAFLSLTDISGHIGGASVKRLCPLFLAKTKLGR
jgi:hypothetical protein